MKFHIENGDFLPIKGAVGMLAYITQGDGQITLEPHAAMELSSALAIWAAQAIRALGNNTSKENTNA